MKRFKSLLIFTLVLALIMQVPLVNTYAEENTKTVTTKVLEISKYGNLNLEAKPSVLAEAGYEAGDMINIEIGETKLVMPYGTSYSDVDTGSLIARHDKKKDLVIIAINMGNFAKTYNVKVDAEVKISMNEKKAYFDEYSIRQLGRTNVRSDYAMDSIFANFRAITSPNIKAGVIYRSSSPINNELKRARYANDLTEAVGIKTVVNLADNMNEVKGYIEDKDFASPYYKNLLDNEKVILLDMDVDLKGENFGQKLVNGLTFIADNEGPYLVHCTEGKDRAGFASAVIEALTGASLDQVVADYMTTYENYYKVEKGSEQYNAVAKSNIITSMTTIVCGLEKGSDLKDVDLAKATEKYLLSLGMKQEKIDLLKEKLAAEPVFTSPSVKGKVKEIEKYGHTSTDIKISDFLDKGFKFADTLTVVYDNGFVVNAPFLDGYYVEKGYPLVRAYKGHETVAVCINYGKIGKIAGVDVGEGLTIFMDAPAEYMTNYEIRKLERTNERADYATDEAFANFREIKLGSIKEGALYRSSSPINNELGRAKYSAYLTKSLGIKTIINMADSKENVDAHLASEDFAAPFYKELLDSNKVILLNMDLAYTGDEFNGNIIKALKFMAANESPYLVHCTEGKDRTGFMSALLEAFMGATKEEIVKDYMMSYDNFYGVKEGTEKYDIISKDVIGMLEHICGTKDLTVENMKAGVVTYMKNAKMTDEEINALRMHLEATKVEKEEPKEEKETAMKHTVVKGDMLWKISLKYLGDAKRYMEIFEANKDILKTPHLIRIGQVLEIPQK